MSGALDAIIWALALGLCAAMCWISFGTSRVHAAEWEIYAERSTATMRTDEPNSRRFRDRNSEPFDSLEDCRQAAIAESRIDKTLGSGWHLKCRPLHVPSPRVVVR